MHLEAISNNYRQLSKLYRMLSKISIIIQIYYIQKQSGQILFNYFIYIFIQNMKHYESIDLRQKKNSLRTITKFRAGLNKSVQIPNSSHFTVTNNSKSIEKSNLYQNTKTKNNSIVSVYQKSDNHELNNLYIADLADKVKITSEQEKNSLKQIQLKLDLLIKQKIDFMKEKNKKKIMRKSDQLDKLNQEILDKKLQKLIQTIKKQKVNPQNTQLIDAWKNLNNKIQLIEKLIAQGSAQLQIMKNNFSFFSANTQYKNMFSKKHQFLNQKFLQSKRSQKQLQSTLINAAKFPIASTNKSEFKAPNQQDYQKFRYQQPEYVLKNGFVPISSYKRNYYKYPDLESLKDKNAKMLDSLQNTNLPSYKDEPSSYKKQFISKRLSTINYKQLDCYKDKFKDLDVLYCRDKKNNTIQQLNSSMTKFGKELDIRPKESIVKFDDNMNIDRLLSSTKQEDYRNNYQKDKQIYFTAPKNQRLQNFKYEYKNYSLN